MGLLLGFAPLFIWGAFKAAINSLSVFTMPQEPKPALYQVPSPEKVVPLPDPAGLVGAGALVVVVVFVVVAFLVVVVAGFFIVVVVYYNKVIQD